MILVALIVSALALGVHLCAGVLIVRVLVVSGRRALDRRRAQSVFRWHRRLIVRSAFEKGYRAARACNHEPWSFLGQSWLRYRALKLRDYATCRDPTDKRWLLEAAQGRPRMQPLPLPDTNLWGEEWD